MIKKLDQIIEKAKLGERKTLAIAVAQDKVVLEAAVQAVRENIVNVILVGDKEKIQAIAVEGNLDLTGFEIVDEKDIKKAAAKSVELVSTGKAHFLMKGMLGTSDLLKAVLNKEAGLKTSNLLSHVMVYDVPSYHKLLFLADGGMVPYPELQDKVGIINNAVKIAHALDIKCPNVGVICAVEVVNPSMQATLDAAALASMNKRGQIKGCIIDGPLALDNAISKEAAAHKGIVSEVAGEADILLVPSIEAGNFLGK